MAIDTTELQAVDFALGALIASMFDNMAPNGPENYVRFLSRDIKDKIFRTEHTDAKDLIDKISADKKGAASTKRPDLPVIGYYRKPGFTNGDDISVSGKRIRWAGGIEDMDNSYKVTSLPISLDYTLTIAAWDKPSLDKVCAAWYAYTGRNRKLRFFVPAKINEDVMVVPANIRDPKNVLFSDASTTDQRIYACTLSFTVVTQMLAGESINALTELEVWGFSREYISRAFEISS